MQSTPNPRTLSASIIITTRNRREELRRAVVSCLRQDVLAEVIIIDDGSNDGTREMISTEFRSVRLESHAESKGLIVRRNEGAQLASGEVVISLDDDAEFSSSDVVRTTLSEFCHSAIAAVAIPFINVRQGSEVKQLAPDKQAVWVTNEFIGTAHAVRRHYFCRLGGYREYLFHQGEEGDFCIRLLASGGFVRLGTAAPIFHHESPRRDLRRINLLGQRNLILFAWYNAPSWAFPIHLIATVLKGLRCGWRDGRMGPRVRGTVLGFKAIAHQWRERRPVPVWAYRMYRRLKKRGPVKLEQLATISLGSG